MLHLLLIVGSGLLIGSLLGALGAGGSTITVPILIYLLGEDVSTAATTSLLIVGITAASGAMSASNVSHAKKPGRELHGVEHLALPGGDFSHQAERAHPAP